MADKNVDPYKQYLESVNSSVLNKPDQEGVAATDPYSDYMKSVKKTEDPKRTIGGTIADIGVGLTKGVVGLGESLVGIADIPTFGAVGKGAEALGVNFKETNQILDNMYSPAQQAANQRVDQAQGFTGTIKAAIQDPSVIGKTILESGASLLGGGALGNAAKGVKALQSAPLIGNIVSKAPAAALGEGLLGAGSSAEGIRQETNSGFLNPIQAGLAATVGGVTGLVSAKSGAVGNKFGIKDVDQMIADKLAGRVAADTTEKASISQIARGVVGGTALEGGEEMLQSGNEQILQNIALQKDPMEGVGKAVAMGGLAGAAMGGGANITSAASNALSTPDTTGSALVQDAKLAEQQAVQAPQVPASVTVVSPTTGVAVEVSGSGGAFESAMFKNEIDKSVASNVIDQFGIQHVVDQSSGAMSRALVASKALDDKYVSNDSLLSGLTSDAQDQQAVEPSLSNAVATNATPRSAVLASIVDNERATSNVNDRASKMIAENSRIDFENKVAEINKTVDDNARAEFVAAESARKVKEELARKEKESFDKKTSREKVHFLASNGRVEEIPNYLGDLDSTGKMIALKYVAKSKNEEAINTIISGMSDSEIADVEKVKFSSQSIEIQNLVNKALLARNPEKAIPKEDKKPFLVNGVVVNYTDLSDSQKAGVDKARADHALALSHISKNLGAEQASRSKKAAGMVLSTKLREATGNLTSKELASKATLEAKIRSGDSVSTPDGSGVVDGNPAYGKVKVTVAGKSKSYKYADVKKVQPTASPGSILKSTVAAPATRVQIDSAIASGDAGSSKATPTRQGQSKPAPMTGTPQAVKAAVDMKSRAKRVLNSVSAGLGDALDKSPNVRFITSEDAKSIPDVGDAKAFFDTADGSVTFIADRISPNITDNQLLGLILHEAGVHGGKLGKSNADFQKILDSLKRLSDSGNKAAQAAFKRVPKNTPDDLINEEAMGYFAEQNPEHALSKRFIDYLKKAVRNMVATLGLSNDSAIAKWSNKMSDSELVQLAMDGLRSYLENGADTGSGVKKSTTEMKEGTDANGDNWSISLDGEQELNGYTIGAWAFRAERESLDSVSKMLPSASLKEKQLALYQASAYNNLNQRRDSLKAIIKIAESIGERSVIDSADKLAKGFEERTEYGDGQIKLKEVIKDYLVKNNDKIRYEVNSEFLDEPLNWVNKMDIFESRLGEINGNTDQKIADLLKFSKQISDDYMGSDNSYIINPINDEIARLEKEAITASVNEQAPTQEPPKRSTKRLSTVDGKKSKTLSGAESVAADKKFDEAFSLAAKSGDFSSLKELIKSGFNFNDINRLGYSFVDQAMSWNYSDSKYGADAFNMIVNLIDTTQKTDHGYSPLERAIEEGNIHATRVLASLTDLSFDGEVFARFKRNYLDNDTEIYSQEKVDTVNYVIEYLNAQAEKQAIQAEVDTPVQEEAPKRSSKRLSTAEASKEAMSSAADSIDKKGGFFGKAKNSFAAAFRETRLKVENKYLALDELVNDTEGVEDNKNPLYAISAYHSRRAEKHKANDRQLVKLKAVLKRIGVTRQQAEQYMLAKFVIEDGANKWFKQYASEKSDPDAVTGMTDAKAQSVLDNAPQGMEEAAAIIRGMIDTHMKMADDAGLITSEQYEIIKKKYPNWLPLPKHSDSKMGSGKGFQVTGKLSVEEGSLTGDTGSILAGIMQENAKIIDMAEKNLVDIKIATFVSIYLKSVDPKEKPLITLDKALTVEDSDPVTGFVKTAHGGFQTFAPPTHTRNDGKTVNDPGYKGKENVVTFKINGETYAMIFDEDNADMVRLAKNLKNMNDTEINAVLAFLGKITRYLSSINTQWNPAFGPFNFLRDAIYVAVTAGTLGLSGPKVVARAIKNFGVVLKAEFGIEYRGQERLDNEQFKAYKKFKEDGGVVAYVEPILGKGEREKKIANAVDSKDNAFSQTWLAVKSGISAWNSMFESSVRFAAYQEALEKFSHEKSLSHAKNITVDFNRKGEISSAMGTLFSFFNSSAQGSARLATALSTKDENGNMTFGKKVLAASAGVGALQVALLAMAGFGPDEPDEETLSKNFYFPLPGGKKDGIKIPYPLGLNAIPNAFRAIIQGSYHGDLGKRIPKMLLSTFDAFNPVGGSFQSPAQIVVPTPLDWAASLYGNQDNFGRKIYREDRDAEGHPTPGFTRHKDGATQASISVAKFINSMTGGSTGKPGFLSPTPDQLDFLGQTAGGGVYRSAKQVYKTTAGDETGNRKFTDVPVVGRLYSNESDPNKEYSRFAERVKEINTHDQALKKARVDGIVPSEYRAENPSSRLIVAAKEAQADIKQFSEMRRTTKEKDVSPERLAAFDAKINGIRAKFNKRYEELMYSGK